MFNLLRMDLRRLFRSRSFYIILAVTAGLILGVVALVTAVTDQEVLDAMESMESVDVQVEGNSSEMRAELEAMTRLDFVHECLGSGFLLLLTGIGVTLFVHSDFASGYIKNVCFVRPRRWEYVLSKILTAGVYSGVIAILGVVISLAGPVLFGLSLAANSIGGILQYTFWIWLPGWTFGLMGLALVLLTRSTTLGIILAVISGGGVTVAILRTVCYQLGWPALDQYLLSSVVQAQCIPQMGAAEMTMILLCAAGWAVVYAAGSFLAMEKRDI